MFRQLRILILLLVLLIVSVSAWLERVRSTDWDSTLWVAVFPLALDRNPAVESYVHGLSSERFASIGEFMQREASRYGMELEEPVRVLLYDEITVPPPQLDPGAGVPDRMLWSLRLRYWAWRNGGRRGRPPPDVRMFVLYHDPAITSTVPHSLGLRKGLIGVVHAFAEPAMDGSNNIVIAHELLHTLGATDKYGADNRPLFPHGYADPDRYPLHPQEYAEIMAGRRALSDTELDMPATLQSVLIGPQTALEIGWER
jgi:hypothetical protein